MNDILVLLLLWFSKMIAAGRQLGGVKRLKIGVVHTL